MSILEFMERRQVRGDKMVTLGGISELIYCKSTGCENIKSGRRAKKAKINRARKPGPIATVKFGSACVLIYRSESKDRIRFMFCSYCDGKRIRRIVSVVPSAS